MGIFDFLDPLTDAISNFLIDAGLTLPAFSTVLLLFVSLIVSSFSGMVNRAVLDMEELADNSKKMKEHQKRKKLAKETADKKLWISVKRNEEHFLDIFKRGKADAALAASIFHDFNEPYHKIIKQIKDYLEKYGIPVRKV